MYIKINIYHILSCRFELKQDDGRFLIRASQGHSMSCINEEELLTRVTSASEIPFCCHGTYDNCLELIMSSGLNKMKRNHIHMAAGKPGEVRSGFRYDCEVLIHIDVEKAMEAGIEFYKSANGVILSPGDRRGSIPSAYFSSVEHLHCRSKRKR